MRLKDKAALVTGAGRGIGRAIALAIAREGGRVAVVDLDGASAAATADEIKSAGGSSVAIQADAGSVESGIVLVGRVVAEFGGVDILVNNAGVQLRKASTLEITPAEWETLMAVNLRGVFFFSQAAARHMVERGEGGRIINVSSVAAKVFWKGLVPYSVSKGGVWAMTGAMAYELAEYGITVNAVAPGYIDTLLNRETFSEPGARERIAGIIPVGRIGEPGDVAGAVVFLASDEAAYITGHVIVIDGGYSLV